MTDSPDAIDGGLGSNRLISPDAATSWTVAQTDGGSVALADQAATTLAQFVHVGNLTGGNQVDTFALQGGLSGQVDGGAGANTVVGPDLNTTWTIFDKALGQTGSMVRSDSAPVTINRYSVSNNALTLAGRDEFPDRRRGGVPGERPDQPARQPDRRENLFRDPQ